MIIQFFPTGKTRLMADLVFGKERLKKKVAASTATDPLWLWLVLKIYEELRSATPFFSILDDEEEEVRVVASTYGSSSIQASWGKVKN